MFWHEFKAMGKLALPIVVLQIGMVLFGVVDTLFMGKIGAQAIAAVGLGHAVIFIFFVFGIGALYGIDSLASRAVGAADFTASARVAAHSVVLALAVALFNFFAATLFVGYGLKLFRLDPSVVPQLQEYVSIVRWMYFPGLVFVACRQFLQSLSDIRPMLWILVVAHAINFAVNYGLVFGNWGLPRLEVRGTAFATLLANIWMGAMLGWIVWRRILGILGQWPTWDKNIFRELVRLGIPGGIQTFFEVSVFSIVSLVMGRLGATTLAAHNLTLNLASVAFMVPMGVSYAAAVRVGYGVGEGSLEKSRIAGRVALVFGVGFMTITCVAFFTVPRFFLGFYTTDDTVLAMGVGLLQVAGIFQVFDGAQVVLTGMLRGLGDTKTSMIANLISHWLIGFPVGIFLTFYVGFHAAGLWIGLSIGLAGVALLLGFIWSRRMRQAIPVTA